jgi:hypothetical protein
MVWTTHLRVDVASSRLGDLGEGGHVDVARLSMEPACARVIVEKRHQVCR